MRRAFLVAVMCALPCAAPAAQATDSFAYMSAGDGTFGVIDLNSGVLTPCERRKDAFAGLAEAGGKLYGGTFYTPELYVKENAGNRFHLVDISNILFYQMGSALGVVYALDPELRLYSVNPETAAATLIGPTGLALDRINWIGMSSGAGRLLVNLNQVLYDINTKTGRATLVMRTGHDLGAITYIHNTLYAGLHSSPRGIAIIRGTAGQAPSVTSVVKVPDHVWGLAPAPGASCR